MGMPLESPEKTLKQGQVILKQSSAIDEEDEEGETPLSWVLTTNPPSSSRRS
jgi:hypothetical protein